MTHNQNLKKNLVLSPDGTLYTVTAEKLLAIGPKTVIEAAITLTGSNLQRNTFYRANNSITVEGFEVMSTINTILHSGGRISFKKAFRVKKGAQLTCKVGY